MDRVVQERDEYLLELCHTTLLCEVKGQNGHIGSTAVEGGEGGVALLTSCVLSMREEGEEGGREGGRERARERARVREGEREREREREEVTDSMYIHVHVQVHLYGSVHGLEDHSPHYLLRLPNRYRYSLQKKTNHKKKELSSGVVACICLVSINDDTCRSKHPWHLVSTCIFWRYLT